jgi:uncharacterized BrkB/YihY/UPF0761 family membrane protein
MQMLGQRATYVLKNPGIFAIQVLKSFRANQELLLSGAVAYYALLSIVPLLILTVIALSHVIDQTELLQTLGRYLEWLVPGQSGFLIGELGNSINHRGVMGWVLLVQMLFFSSLAFTVLENAMSVIHHHHNSQAPLSRLGGDSVLRYSFSRSWTATGDPCCWEPERHGTGSILSFDAGFDGHPGIARLS